MTLDKLASAAGKLHTFFKVLQKITGICMIAVLCVMTVITAVHIINPDAVIGENTNTVDLGPITVNLAEENAFTNCLDRRCFRSCLCRRGLCCLRNRP